MHDPLVVAWEIRRPWPKRARYNDAKQVPEGKRPKPRWYFSLPFFTVFGKGWHFPDLITIWHREPGGRDSGEVCKHHHRVQDATGQWRYVFHHAWKFHVHHWSVQVHPWQHLRRWALTRCEWCGGRSRKRDAVNVSHQWDGPRGPWWRGERGLFHMDCSSVKRAQSQCLCDEPGPLTNGDHGTCAYCGKFRVWRNAVERTLPPPLSRVMLASLPEGSRIPASMRPELERLWAEERAERSQL